MTKRELGDGLCWRCKERKTNGGFKLIEAVQLHRA